MMSFHLQLLLSALRLCSVLSTTKASYITQPSTSRAAYLISNDPTGNSVVALAVSETDGTLSSPVLTSTLGLGMAELIAPSQDSVTVSGKYLFVVNPGSNTVSMFTIDPADPLHPVLIGLPASTLGDTPVSVAYSSSLKTACVVNGGATAGVACFSVDDIKGLEIIGPLRVIPQTEDADPTTAPPGPLVLSSDIRFNPSSSAVFTAVRSNGGQPGLVYAWPVAEGQLSTTPIISSLPGLPLFFSFDFIDSDSRMLATNPHQDSPGAAILDVSTALVATNEQTITIPGQVASCWIALAPAFDSTFIVDAGTPNVTILDMQSGAIKDVFHIPAPGAQDSAVDRDWFYTLTLPTISAPQVIVYNILGIRQNQPPKQVQTFDLSGVLGQSSFWVGFSIYPSVERGSY